MPKEIVLEEIQANGIREVARITGGEVVLGREPDHGIALGHQAISREHGVIMRMRNHWFYKDLGSTNGSWINNERIPGHEWRIVRPEDYVQLADVALRIRLDDTDATQGGSGSLGLPSGRSLIIFSEGRFIDEFPIPEFGRALVVGGSQADLDIQGDTFDSPSLVVERRGDQVCAFNVAKKMELYRAKALIEETVALKDRDMLEIGEYQILYSDPPSPSALQPRGPGLAAGIAGSSLDQRLKGWGERDPGPDLQPAPIRSDEFSRPVPKSGFGRSYGEDDLSYNETVSVDSSMLGSTIAGDVHPSMRHGAIDFNMNNARNEDRVILLVAMILMILLFLLLIWWFLW